MKVATDFSAALGQSLEAMGLQADVRWEPAPAMPPDLAGMAESGVLWWQQSLQILPGPMLWVGAPSPTWEEIGRGALRAVGVDTAETSDARSTWLEILSQALAAVARSMGAQLACEVTCGPGGEAPPPAEAVEWANLTVSLGGSTLPLALGVATVLLERLAGPAASSALEIGSASIPPDLASGSTLDLLLDVDLPVSISFGRTQIPLRDVLKLTTGSIVELNRGVGEPVEVLVNQSLIARGEVVVIDGNYGVRIQQIIRSEDRLRSVR